MPWSLVTFTMQATPSLQSLCFLELRVTYTIRDYSKMGACVPQVG